MQGLYEAFTGLKFAAAVLIGLALSAVYYLVLFDDGSVLDRKTQAQKVKLQSTIEEIRKVKQDISEANRLKDKVEQLSTQYREALQYLPTEWRQDELITEISKQAQVAGVRIVKINPKKDTKIQQGYEKMVIDFELSGTFTEVAIFLSNMTKIKRLISIGDFELVNKSEDVDSPVLVFTGDFFAYRYLKEDEVNAKKETVKPTKDIKKKG